jgi:hypothetical protein
MDKHTLDTPGDSINATRSDSKRQSCVFSTDSADMSLQDRSSRVLSRHGRATAGATCLDALAHSEHRRFVPADPRLAAAIDALIQAWAGWSEEQKADIEARLV